MNKKHKLLAHLKTGKKAKIISVRGGRGFNKKVGCMGLREGQIVKMVSRQPFMGPLTVSFGNCNVTIGRGMAHKILVEEL